MFTCGWVFVYVLALAMGNKVGNMIQSNATIVPRSISNLGMVPTHCEFEVWFPSLPFQWIGCIHERLYVFTMDWLYS